MGVTAKGIRYPSNANHTRTWEHWQALAEDVDDLFTVPAIGKAASITAQTGITTETVSLTVSSMVFKAGWAYEAKIRTAVYGTAAALALFRIRKTNAAGTDWGEFGRVQCIGVSAGQGVMVNGSIYLIRSAGTDLTADVALTASPSTGTINMFAASASPRTLTIVPVGPASEYSGQGVDVT